MTVLVLGTQGGVSCALVLAKTLVRGVDTMVLEGLSATGCRPAPHPNAHGMLREGLEISGAWEMKQSRVREGFTRELE